MCGRYTLTSQADLVAEFELATEPALASPWWRPRFNVAPTQPAPVVANRAGERRLELMRWGFQPAWSRAAGGKPRGPMINARVETAAQSPAFREAVRRRRCLVVADGFFEWKRDGSRARPIHIHPQPRHPIAFAGIWERAHLPDGEVESFAILTCPANGWIAPVHDRMPLILSHDAYARWLEAESMSAAELAELAASVSTAGWAMDEVSPRVNRPENDDAACLDPPSEDPPPAAPRPPRRRKVPGQGDLF